MAISASARSEVEGRELFEPLRAALTQIGHPEPHPVPAADAADSDERQRHRQRSGRSAAGAAAAPALGETELRALLFAPIPRVAWLACCMHAAC